MKSTFKTRVAFVLTAIIFVFINGNAFSQVGAQDPTSQTQEFDIKIDKLGDATLELSTKMNQAQWENFKTGPLVNDPSISKRDMERNMSTYVLEDFKRDIDDMNRAVKITVKVKAFAAYNGNGKWSLMLGTKDPQITKLSDNAYMSTTNTMMNGLLVQQIYKISFPSGAKDIQQSTDSFGKAMFTYTNGGGIGSYLKWNNILGLLLIIAAVVVFLNLSKKPNIIGPDHQIEHTGLKV